MNYRVLLNFGRNDLFAAALVKKKKYWPKYIDGDRNKTYFKDKHIDTVDGMKGSLNGMKVEGHCLKRPEQIMMPMSSYGNSTLERVGGMIKRECRQTKVAMP